METTFSSALKVVSRKWQVGVDLHTVNVGHLISMRLLGNYLQQGPEGSFPEMAKYQNLHFPVANFQIRKLPGNDLQESPEGSFREVVRGN